MNYAIDTYGDLVENNWKWQIEGNGRLITALFFYLVGKIPVHFNYIYTASYLISILALSLAAYLLYTHILKKQKQDSSVVLLIAVLSVSNYLLVNFFSGMSRQFIISPYS